MKNLSKNEMIDVQGGASNRACFIAGGATLGYMLFQQWGWAVGTFAGAALSGCFD